MKSPVFGIFLVRIFPHSDWYLFVSSPNSGKYGPEKSRIRTLFTQWVVLWSFSFGGWLWLIVFVAVLNKLKKYMQWGMNSCLKLQWKNLMILNLMRLLTFTEMTLGKLTSSCNYKYSHLILEIMVAPILVIFKAICVWRHLRWSVSFQRLFYFWNLCSFLLIPMQRVKDHLFSAIRRVK